MSCKERSNRSLNFEYLINCTSITFVHSEYVPGQTIPGLKISLSTLKNALSGKSFSDKTARMVAGAFSLFLVHSKRKITKNDLDLNPEDFKKAFPASAFSPLINSKPYINVNLFTNKLYRAYYMQPNSPNSAFIAYFKLMKKDGDYHAYMIRGIEDLKRENEIKELFYSPDLLLQNIKNINSEHKIGSIHLYEAWTGEKDGVEHEDIIITKNCIKIDFSSVEEDPCYSTMFWNVCMANSMNVLSYIGGTALIVDTNDGKRGKDICSFKMGLEAIEGIPSSQSKTIAKGALIWNSPRVIKELSLESSNGIFALTNSDDDLWYRFIQGSDYRGEMNYDYNNVNVEQLVSSLAHIKTDYERELTRLRKMIEEMKENT